MGQDIRFLIITILFFIFGLSTAGFTQGNIVASDDNEINMQRYRKQADFTYKELIGNKKILSKLKASGMLLACGIKAKSKEIFEKVLNDDVRKMLPQIVFKMVANGIPMKMEDTAASLIISEASLRRFTGGYAYAFAEVLTIKGELEANCKAVVQQFN